MPKYFIIWNSTRTEGFITDDKRDADAALSGRPYREAGLSMQSIMGANFHEQYEEDGLSLQEVDLEEVKGAVPPLDKTITEREDEEAEDDQD